MTSGYNDKYYLCNNGNIIKIHLITKYSNEVLTGEYI